MSIKNNQTENMRCYHQWTDKIREIEKKFQKQKQKAEIGNLFYGYQLDQAKRKARLNYELATNRGF